MNATVDRKERLVVVLDGQPVLEYRPGHALKARQLEYLRRMDARLDAGIELGGQAVARPDPVQRAQFVALRMIEALQAGEEQPAAAALAWLATRMPDLKQVRAGTGGDAVPVELVFDEPWVEEVAVSFTPRLN
ncbi:MAG TPA: hypothetical protein ENJ79_07280 [Gammaproteobacteria bacterium]|nr:hypothetical protein [Gammaproteobacteria bacterium]